MKLYSSGMLETNSLMPYVLMSSQDTKQTEYAKLEPTDNEQVASNETQQDATAGFDLFKHTRVDIDEKQIESMKHDAKQMDPKDDTIHSYISGSKDIGIMTPKELHDAGRKDIFCFFKLCVDLPKTFFKDLGDTKVVTNSQETEIKDFILQRWPQLNRRKFIWRIAFSSSYQGSMYNTVLLGKEAPLSKCCMRSVNIQFNEQIGGKVVCLDSLCANNPLDTFEFSATMQAKLFQSNQI